MAKTFSGKISVKASVVKLWGNPLPKYKTFAIDPTIQFYKLEDSNKNEEVE